MRRSRRVVWGAVAVAAATAGAAIAGAAPAPAPPPPGTALGCPLHDSRPVTSTRPGASAELVPSGAVRLLVCSYSGFSEPRPLPQTGPAHRLIGDGLLVDQATVQRIADELNAIPPSTGPVACPADFGNNVVAYFRYASAPDDPVTIGLSGCEAITNGQLNRLGMDASVVTQIAALAAPGTLRGRLELCGGPAPGRCRTETFTSCSQPRGCVTTDRVAVFTTNGVRLITVRLRHARFSVELPAGRYRLELIGDGRRIHGDVMDTTHARVRAAHTTAFTFGIAIP